MHPDQVMQNSNCKEGDLLVLTKPLGIGVLTTANKAQLLDQQTYDQMVEAMGDLKQVRQGRDDGGGRKRLHRRHRLQA